MPANENHQEIKYGNFISNRITVFLSAIIVTIAALTALFPIDNFDIWWHLKTGEIIVSELSVPTTDIYSFTAGGSEWITHEWLAEVIFYALYSLGGMNLLIIFKVLIAVLIALLLLYNLRRGKDINLMIYILITAAVCVGSFRMFVRPHLFTYLFLTLLMLNLSRYNEFFKSKRLKWFLIPLMFMAWANLHSGFIIGLGIYGIVSIGAFINHFRGKPNNDRKAISGFQAFLVPGLLAAIASLINPNGIKAFAYPFLLASEPVFRNAIAEMVSPFEVFGTQKLYLILLIVILGFACYGIWKNIKNNPAFSLILVIGAVSALTSIRNSYEAAIITSSIMIVTLKGIPLRMLYIGVIAILLSISGFCYYTAKYIRDTRGIGLGAVTDLPYEGAEFLKKIEYEGNIYSPLGWGSYFIWKGWPDWKVFIDGRLLVYGPDHLNGYHYIRQNEPKALQYLEQSGAQAVALPLGQQRWRIRDAVGLSDNWRLCYFDDKSVFYLKINDHNRRWLEQWGFEKIDPLKIGYLNPGVQRSDTTLILIEAVRAYKQSPGSVTTNAVLARAQFLNSDFNMAVYHYKAALRLEPKMIDFYYQVATSYYRGGGLDSAAVWYERAIAANPHFEASYFEYGTMEADRGQFERAIEIWGKALKINPQSAARKFIEDAKRQISAAKGGSED